MNREQLDPLRDNTDLFKYNIISSNHKMLFNLPKRMKHFKLPFLSTTACRVHMRLTELPPAHMNIRFRTKWGDGHFFRRPKQAASTHSGKHFFSSTASISLIIFREDRLKQFTPIDTHCDSLLEIYKLQPLVLLKFCEPSNILTHC